MPVVGMHCRYKVCSLAQVTVRWPHDCSTPIDVTGSHPPTPVSSLPSTVFRPQSHV